MKCYLLELHINASQYKAHKWSIVIARKLQLHIGLSGDIRSGRIGWKSWMRMKPTEQVVSVVRQTGRLFDLRHFGLNRNKYKILNK